VKPTEFYKVGKRLARYKQRIGESKEITPENKAIALDFLEKLPSESISQVRVLFYAMRVIFLAQWIGKASFRNATESDLRALATRINSLKKEDGEDASPQTKEIYRVSLVKLMEYLGRREAVSWFKASKKLNNHAKLVEERLTEEEIMRMLNNATSERDRALIAVMADAGFRIGELSSMTVGGAVKDDLGYLLTVSGKTGSRRARLTSFSIPFLLDWLRVHPRRGDKEAPLWCATTGKPLSVSGFSQVLLVLKKRLGIEHRNNVHSFRSAAVTRALADGMPEQIAKIQFGWTQGSKMIQTYSRLGERDRDHYFAKKNGAITEDEKPAPALPKRICWKCGFENEATIFTCKCGQPLTATAAITLDDSITKEVIDLKNRILPLLEELAELRKEKTK
jgi:integrase